MCSEFDFHIIPNARLVSLILNIIIKPCNYIQFVLSHYVVFKISFIYDSPDLSNLHCNFTFSIPQPQRQSDSLAYGSWSGNRHFLTDSISFEKNVHRKTSKLYNVSFIDIWPLKTFISKIMWSFGMQPSPPGLCVIYLYGNAIPVHFFLLRLSIK